MYKKRDQDHEPNKNYIQLVLVSAKDLTGSCDTFSGSWPVSERVDPGITNMLLKWPSSVLYNADQISLNTVCFS